MSAVSRGRTPREDQNFAFFSFPKTGAGRVALASAGVSAAFNFAQALTNYSIFGAAFVALNLGVAHYAIHRLENPGYESSIESAAKKVFKYCCCCCKKTTAPESSERRSERSHRSRERDDSATRRSSSADPRRRHREESHSVEDFESLLSQPVERRPSSRELTKGSSRAPVAASASAAARRSSGVFTFEGSKRA